MALRVKQNVSFLDMLMMNAKGNVVDAITPGVKAGGELARVYELKKVKDRFWKSHNYYRSTENSKSS